MENKMALAALTLMACRPLTPQNLDADEQRAVSAVIQAAGEEGLDVSKCYLEDAKVVYAKDADDFSTLCFGVTVEMAAACLFHYQEQRGLEVYALPQVNIAPGLPVFDTTGGPVVHELCHWVGGCVLNDLDHLHKNPKLFTQAGATQAERAASLQGRAKAILGYPVL